MPLAHLIFFPEPVELTEAQVEEARALGHLRAEAPEGAAAGPLSASGTGTVTGGDDTAGASGDDDHTDE